MSRTYTMRILVCEDQKDLNKITVKHLTAEGYSVDGCYDGQEALDFLDMANYDAVVLDIMMPKKDGISVLKEMRRAGNNTPVIFLTAKDSIEDRVKGLDLGADDYLIKPFSFDELLARIRAITRKSSGNSSNIFTVADLTLDVTAHTVFRAGKEVSLSAKEFSLLEYMLRNKGRVLTRSMIENNIWNFDYEGGTNAVDVYIRYLRKKIDDDFEPKLIHTIRGSGYVLKEK